MDVIEFPGRSAVSKDGTTSFRMSAAAPSYAVHSDIPCRNGVISLADSAARFRTRYIRSVAIPSSSVHSRSISAHRSLEETGRRLGLTAFQVEDLVVNGPLVGRETEEGLVVHDDDLAAYLAGAP